MTQEEKELLLKDLCARLPYGAKLNIKGQDGPKLYNFVEDLYTIWIEGRFSINDRGEGDEDGICEIKPYLRPMSSMNREENKVYNELCSFYPCSIAMMCNTISSYELIDWLNVNHFDYRGLIEKGLAFEAPEGMYRTE